MVKIRVSMGSRVVKHAFLGTLYALLNETSYRFFRKNKTDDDQDLIPLNAKQEELKMAHDVFYKKEDIFKKIDENFHLSYHPNDRKSEFLKHFIYGSLIAILGIETMKYLRGLPRMKNVSNFYHILMGTPIAIVPYYAFCSFYDRKTLGEFWMKLSEDFLPLAAAKFGFDMTQANYAQSIQNMSFDNMKKINLRVKRATVLLILFNTVWIFMMTSFYHNRVSLKRMEMEKDSIQN